MSAIASDSMNEPQVRFVWTVLQIVALLFDVDPHDITKRRRKNSALYVRKALFYALKPFISNTSLAKITGFNRSTIEDDVAEVEAWRATNAMISDRLDWLCDMVEPMRALIEERDAFLDDMAAERAAQLLEPTAAPALPAPKVIAMHPLALAFVKAGPVIRALGPIIISETRPPDAIAWMHVEDTPGAMTLRISWAGAKDTLHDALPVLVNQLRAFGKPPTYSHVVDHPTMRNKYMAVLRIGGMLKTSQQPAAATR